MAPPVGSERLLTSPAESLELPPPAAGVRPTGAPLATTIVLFLVVAVLLAFIAWR